MAVELPSEDPSSTASTLVDSNDHYDETDLSRPSRNHNRPTVPRLQLFVILLIQISEPITATVIYPFVNQFVKATGVTEGDERKTGYYAGLIESVFFLAEALTVFQWGWLSDQLGRKPVLLLGPLGLAFAMLGFGLSKTFLSLVMFRCMQGVFNGNIGVSKSVLAEISDPTSLAEVFSLLPLMWSLGITVGPIIGGIFSNPVDNWPRVFGHIRFLRENPYFLPCAIASCFALFSVLFGLAALRETLPMAPMRQRCISCLQRQLQRLNGKKEETTTLFDNSTVLGYGTIESCQRPEATGPKKSIHSERQPSYRDLFIRPLLVTYLNYFFVAFSEMAHNALLPLMYSTSVSLGGLGLDAYRIGMLMGAFGLVNATLQLKYLGKLTRRYGPRKIYICSYASFLLCTGLFPVASYLCRRNGGVNWLVGSVVVLQLIAQIPILACYASMHILVVTNAPKGAMGAANGMAQLVASSMKAVAPTVATSLFSISLQENLLGGYMVYFILLAVVCTGIRLSILLPETESPPTDS
ncbi:major facilitator superfamily multidrug-resistance, DHA1 sub-family [Coprinopsis sp. MPI-PUGE-AT-0042]|nr:major facilitator superfamily multidrug-resistance, DHA1 sub-family [Coprinopsis sp. MPI-PUGE-AT-0042]